MEKSCATCGKPVYPMEQLRCMDQIWHKACFKCQVCNMTLNLKNYRASDKKPFCNAHCPQLKSYTVVSDSQEIQRVKQNTAVISQVSYAGKKASATTGTPNASTPDVVNRRGSETLLLQQQLQQQPSLRPQHQRGSINDFDPERHDTFDRRLDPNAGRRGSTIFASKELPPPSPSASVSRSDSRLEQAETTSPDTVFEEPPAAVEPLNVETAQTQQAVPQPEQVVPERQQAVPQPEQAVPKADPTVPRPEQAVPKPEQAILEPEQAVTKPEQEVPQPEQAVTEPVQTIPQPEQTVPQPEQAVPQPYQSVPQPYQSVPQPYQSVPQPEQAVTQSEQAVPQPEQAVSQTEQAVSQTEQTVSQTEQTVSQIQDAVQQQQTENTSQPQEASESVVSVETSAATVVPPPTVTKPASAVERNRGRCYVAQFSYIAQDVDEVSFSEGDIITNGDQIDAGWMYGIVERTGNYGMLPFNYVEELQ